METGCESTKTYESSAYLSQRQTAELEAALRYSARLDAADRAEAAARNNIHKDLADLALSVVDDFEHFSEWRASCERNWSFHPDAYDLSAHLELKAVEGTWFDIHRRMVRMMDWLERGDLMCSKAEVIRARYAIMLSVELMDTGAMPANIEALARDAIREHAKGRIA